MLFSATTLLRAALLLPTTLAQTPPPAHTIHQFPLPTWLENIFATSNGFLLTGTLGFGANLHLINPFTNAPSTDTLIHTFPTYNSILGITEYLPNTFALITSNYSPTSGPTLGSSSAWSVQLCENGTVGVDKIADLKDTKMINGIVALNDETVLLADSYAGNVVALSPRTGKYNVVLQDTSMAPNTSTSASTGIGINGLKYNAPYLYYSNTGRNSMHRVRVDATTGKPKGPFEKLASLEAPDDFAVTDHGTIFVARPFANLIERIGGDGSVVPIAAANGTTAATLGRTWRDRNVLYASTMGGFAADGSFLEGGKVVAVTIN